MAGSLNTTNPTRRAILSAVPATAICGVALVPALAMPLDISSVDQIRRLVDLERRLAAVQAEIDARFHTDHRLESHIPWKPNLWRRHQENGARFAYRCRRAQERWETRYLPFRESIRDNRLNLDEQRFRLVEEGCTIKASTLESLKIKAHLAQTYNGMIFSVLADIIAL
jgi:hypothetical protein